MLPVGWSICNLANFVTRLITARLRNPFTIIGISVGLTWILFSLEYSPEHIAILEVFLTDLLFATGVVVLIIVCYFLAYAQQTIKLNHNTKFVENWAREHKQLKENEQITQDNQHKLFETYFNNEFIKEGSFKHLRWSDFFRTQNSLTGGRVMSDSEVELRRWIQTFGSYSLYWTEIFIMETNERANVFIIEVDDEYFYHKLPKMNRKGKEYFKCKGLNGKMLFGRS